MTLKSSHLGLKFIYGLKNDVKANLFICRSIITASSVAHDVGKLINSVSRAVCSLLRRLVYFRLLLLLVHGLITMIESIITDRMFSLDLVSNGCNLNLFKTLSGN